MVNKLAVTRTLAVVKTLRLTPILATMGKVVLIKLQVKLMGQIQVHQRQSILTEKKRKKESLLKRCLTGAKHLQT